MLDGTTSKNNEQAEIRVVSRRGDGVPRPKTLPDLLRLLEAHRHGMSARVTVWIGAELARDILEKNHPKNRAVGPGHLKKLLQQHQAGKFLYTPAPIVLGPDGTLGDGQHRCTMVTQAGSPIMADVCQMFDASAFEAARIVVDTGRTRTRGHVLEIAGLVDSGKGATANSILSRIGYFHVGIESTRSNMEQVAMFRPWAAATNKAMALGHRWNLSMRAAAAICFQKNTAAAEELFAQFEAGVDFKKGQPAHALSAMRDRFREGRGRAHEEETMLFIFKAAYKHMKGDLLRSSPSSQYGYSTRPSPHALDHFFGSYLRTEWRERAARLRKGKSEE